jgi:hypothetical protein
MIRVLFYLVCLLYFKLAMASIEMTIQPNPAQVGEEVQLIIKQKGASASHSIPDISALSKDFQIAGTQQSMSYQMMNGVSQHENIWIIILIPKHTGQIHIPVIEISGERSEPQTIEVAENFHSTPQNTSGESKSEKLNSVFLQWLVEPEQAVLHEQIKLTLKVYHQLPLLDAKLSPPHVENALLYSVEQHQHKIEMIKGHRYEVEIYQYLIYPQKAEKLKITPPVLDALEYDLMPTPVRATLNEKVIQVLPPIVKIKDWLPAKSLNFEELSPVHNNLELPFGDTFTRKIRVSAEGVPANLIPDINTSCGEHCKVYIHTLDSSNKILDGELFGSKTFEMTYLPNQSGQVEILPIHIDWFNVKTRKQETMGIPGVQLNILPESVNQHEEHADIQQTSPWIKLPTWLGILLGMALGIFGVRLGRGFSWNKWMDRIKQIEFQDRTLKIACLKGDATKVREELLVWAKKAYSSANIHDLHDISHKLTSGELKNEVEKLSKFLFSKHYQSSNWDGKTFWDAFKKFKKPAPESMKKPKVSSNLNPN